uniref:Ulp1 protease family, C-terminal catalytic domain-containing protein n=1 Tax=Tanacetum cinerariifolium TaxID=118510 RepID=A0A6L2MBN1_TANCI|nr:ulp1 protease family, C-terminal catalytic domain-containing protein [Tanacetum cinerariifolium]
MTHHPTFHYGRWFIYFCFFYGPGSGLLGLSPDTRDRPALRSWNTTTMKKMIQMETEIRCLGKLEHLREFNPEEEQDGMNVYKRLDVYVPSINDKEPESKEEFYEKRIQKFDKVLEERCVLIHTLTYGVTKFGRDKGMIDFFKAYKEMFNDAEFNLYESSNDEDSESNVDGDNDKNNNNDGDGEPMADAKKKNKSNNEKEKQNKEDIDNEIKSKGTEESRNEGTEENGSETTKGKSDGKEENMNGDEREVKAQMDVDNHEKQEKQDIDKDENAVKEKVETCEELENQAMEEIKKKKTAKRKSAKEMTPPSFSICLSPDTNKVEERAPKRAKKPSRFIISPYINKKTATKGNAVQDEMMICSYLFSMEGNELMNNKGKDKAFLPHRDDLFNFLKRTTMIIDNSKTPISYDAKYKKVCDVLKNMFSMHLKEVQHPRAKEVLNKKPTILRPKWGTEKNNTDYGVFLRMHMENYNRENAKN